MGFLKNLLLNMLGKKKVIGLVGAGLIMAAAFVLGEPASMLKDAICSEKVMEVPEGLKAKSPIYKDKKVDVKPAK